MTHEVLDLMMCWQMTPRISNYGDDNLHLTDIKMIEIAENITDLDTANNSSRDGKTQWVFWIGTLLVLSLFCWKGHATEHPLVILFSTKVGDLNDERLRCQEYHELAVDHGKKTNCNKLNAIVRRKIQGSRCLEKLGHTATIARCQIDSLWGGKQLLVLALFWLLSRSKRAR